MMRSTRSSTLWRGRWTGAASSYSAGRSPARPRFARPRGPGSARVRRCVTTRSRSASPRATRRPAGRCSGPGSHRTSTSPTAACRTDACRSSGAWRRDDGDAPRGAPGRRARGCRSWRTRCTSELSGLDPGREYFFQFKYRDELSPHGSDAHRPGERGVGPLAGLRVRLLPGLGPRLLLRLPAHGRRGPRRSWCISATTSTSTGSTSSGGARKVPVPDQFRPECETLDRYRLQYSLYKSDPDLQRGPPAVSRGSSPGTTTRSTNDYAGAITGGRRRRHRAVPGAAGGRLPGLLRAPAAACRGRCRPAAPPLLYRRAAPGATWRAFNVLDTRQYRTDQPCGDGEFPRCPESLDPAVTMLGAEQEDWLLGRARRARSARWNVIAQQVMMAAARPRPRRPEDLLARRLGRLPGRAAADHRPSRRPRGCATRC